MRALGVILLHIAIERLIVFLVGATVIKFIGKPLWEWLTGDTDDE
jgi:hypothetical protein